VARTLTIELNDAEEAKLDALAAYRKRSTVQCIRDFIAACQPGGSGWQPWQGSGDKPPEK
jgi:predicted transcriptional regulator